MRVGDKGGPHEGDKGGPPFRHPRKRQSSTSKIDRVHVEVRHGGKFVGFEYVGGEIFEFPNWELAFKCAFFTEMFLLDYPYSRIVKAAFRDKSNAEFKFINLDDDYPDDLMPYIDERKNILEVFVEFDTDIHGVMFAPQDQNEEQTNCDKDTSREVEFEERAGLNDGLQIEELDEDDDLDDGLSTDDEEWEEARKILREERRRCSQKHVTTEGEAMVSTEGIRVSTIEEQVVTDDDVRADDEERADDDGSNGAAMSPIEELELNSDEDIDILEDDDDNDPTSNKARKLYVKTSKPGELKLETGLTFRDSKECQKAVKDWAIENGYDIKWTKSARGKLQAICRGECSWKLYASKERLEPTCVIRTLIEPHECSRVRKNRQINAEWLAEYFLPKFRINPNYTAQEMVADIFQRYEADINFAICYRARDRAVELITGSLNEHYAKLIPYVTELKRNDKEGRFELMTHLNADGGRVFDRIYVGFSSLKKGFFIGCRRFIGFDACFLKTVLGGVLLAAISKNGDNKMFPIAWAVVEKETEATWKWFFEILFEELNIGDGLGWTFMSDKQKGLINGIASLAPHSEHRHCARHIYANWRKKFSGPKFKGLFWGSVRATTQPIHALSESIERRISSCC